MDFTVKDLEKIQKVISENGITVEEAINIITKYIFLCAKDWKDYLVNNEAAGEHTQGEHTQYDGHGNVRIENVDEKESLA